MVRRKPRDLTPEESVLWRQVARTAKAIRPESAHADVPAETLVQPAAEPASSVPAPLRAAPLPSLKQVRLRNGPAFVSDTFDALGAVRSSLDARRAERLRRGKLAPERRLDLHGLTQERARAALMAFILGAQADGLRLVLVITGKGRSGSPDALVPERHGVLRHAVPHWLATPPLTGRIIDVRPAHRRHGGQGALYVYLRRLSR